MTNALLTAQVGAARCQPREELLRLGDTEAIDVFLRREDAEIALAECLADEPDWKDILRVVPIELDAREASAN